MKDSSKIFSDDKEILVILKINNKHLEFAQYTIKSIIY